jgi:hypothetical protein
MVGYALSTKAQAQAPVMTIKQKQAWIISQMDPKSYARHLIKAQHRDPETQYRCLAALWGKESAWNHKAKSPTHDYGIPQRHMSHNTPAQIRDFLKDPHAQVRWGLTYIESRYKTPCGALRTWLSRANKNGKGGWY